MKRIILCVIMCAAVTIGCSGCGGGNDADDGKDDKSVSSETENKTNTLEIDITEDDGISYDEAYEIAKAYVPNAILDSAMLDNATGYVITDYEYEGVNVFDEYRFKFYGKWYAYDNYGDMDDYGKYYAIITVSESGYASGTAYPEF